MVQYSLSDGEEWIQLKKAWEQVLVRLSVDIPTQWFERFIRPLQPLRQEGDVVTALAPSKFVCEWVKDRYSAQLQSMLSDELGREVKLELQSDARTKSEAVAVAVAAKPTATVEPMVFHPNEKYTFGSFIVGQSNQLAVAGAKQVAANPGTRYNPLFIYGPSGKTHLLHAIAREIQQSQPDAEIAYVSAQKFSEDFVQALQNGRIEQFRRSFRRVAVWLVDDIQFLAGRDRTQEEVFHTFNTLHSFGRQMVLTSDRPPRELYTMDERLRSRFESGLVADIQAPDTETRCAIVLSKASQENIPLDVSVAMVLAEHVPGNIRILEGALNRLVAEASLNNTSLTEAFALGMVERYYLEGGRTKPNHDLIIKEVGDHFNVPVEDITGQRRLAYIVQARHVAIYVLREITGDSWKRIGAYLGNRDHTSMMHGYQKINHMMVRDLELRGSVKQILRRLKPQS